MGKATWRRLPLSTVVEIRSGSTPSKVREEYWGGSRPWVSAKDMKATVLFDSLDHLTEAGYAAGSVARAGSVLVLTRGMTLFKDVPVCLAGTNVAFNQDVKALIPSQELDALYLTYFLRAQKQTLLSLIDSAGHGTGRFDTDALRSVDVLVPPLDEQRRIADILATWDAAIEKTERLIGAKSKQRAWLTRLLINQPVAAGVWRRVPLRQVCRPVTRKNVDGTMRVLTSSARLGLVDQLEYFNKDVSGVDLCGYYLLKPGEFAYNRSTSDGYPYGAIKRLDGPEQGVLSTLYICFGVAGESISSDFLCHFFESGVMNRELGQICQAGSRSHGLLNVTKTDFFSLEVSLPDRTQQDKIVHLLAEADREIELLKRLRAAHRAETLALAHSLLRGT